MINAVRLLLAKRKEIRTLRDLLQRHQHELKNMRLKLAAKEDEGWEGTRRRDVLMRETADILCPNPNASTRNGPLVGPQQQSSVQRD